jgi:hypothetical protein
MFFARVVTLHVFPAPPWLLARNIILVPNVIPGAKKSDFSRPIQGKRQE